MHVVLVAFLSLALARSGGADAPVAAIDGLEQRIQLAVEQVRSGAPVEIAGATLASRTVLPELYERRGFRPAWSSEAADDLLRAIREVEADGLDPADYHLATLDRVRAAPDTPARQADLDLLLTDAVVRLAYHLRFGKVDPTQLDPNWNLTSDLGGKDPTTLVQEALDAGRVHDALEELKPRYPLYQALKRALAEHRAIERAGGWPQVPPGPKLTRETNDPRVTILRRRLVVTGDLPAAADNGGSAYDAEVESGVKTFQARHGLAADGAVGPGTLAALNVPVAHRIDQIRATLERCRWVMHDLPERFVLVNVAGFTVRFFRAGGSVWESAAVVGKPFTKTPIFRADMKYVVVNPTWTVPPGIMRSEIIPGMRRDPGYLEKKGLRMVNGQVVQPAGPRNALGRIKLMFPNEHSVYLHDTPSKSYFKEVSRTFSHGCVRVEKPFELAALALDDPAWTTETLLAAADAGSTRTILLHEPLPVLILYWTATLGADGRIAFVPDVYGRDPAIIRALHQSMGSLTRTR